MFGRQPKYVCVVKLTRVCVCVCVCVCYILTHTVRLVEGQVGKTLCAVSWSLHLIPPQWGGLLSNRVTWSILRSQKVTLVAGGWKRKRLEAGRPGEQLWDSWKWQRTPRPAKVGSASTMTVLRGTNKEDTIVNNPTDWQGQTAVYPWVPGAISGAAMRSPCEAGLKQAVCSGRSV